MKLFMPGKWNMEIYGSLLYTRVQKNGKPTKFVKVTVVTEIDLEENTVSSSPNVWKFILRKYRPLVLLFIGLTFNYLESLWFGKGTVTGINAKAITKGEFLYDDISFFIMAMSAVDLILNPYVKKFREIPKRPEAPKKVRFDLDELIAHTK